MGEYQLEKSNELAKELESLRYELEPLEEVSRLSALTVYIDLPDYHLAEKNGTGQKGWASHQHDDLGGSRTDVRAIWHPRAIDLVGILLGYYGASDLFRYLWHDNGHVRLLLCNEARKLNESIIQK